MLLRKHILYIYTDGSSLPTPRRGGIAARYVFLNESEEEQTIDLDLQGFESATNNQMELKAVIEGLRRAPMQPIPFRLSEIEVRTDSRYVTDNKGNAVFSWSQNDWLNHDGRPVENAILWKELIKVLRSLKCRVEFKWVKGHAKDPNNKAVDKLAKQSAKALLKQPIFVTKLRRKKSSTKTKVGSIPMEGQTLAIHIINDQILKLQRLSKYRYEIISPSSPHCGLVDLIFSTHHHLKAGHLYTVVFNTNQKDPRIIEVVREIKKGEHFD